MCEPTATKPAAVAATAKILLSDMPLMRLPTVLAMVSLPRVQCTRSGVNHIASVGAPCTTCSPTMT